ncbi:DUF4190 domain-containing protein [Streptomyces sp. HNM0575]|uniref:DUF4190 domain-containing protein n=1 Tax=Streptomyces sp. HNM0575 TaxID=2716338 RepID=UPI0019D1CFC6|nr:DUF4190 domain-containing protein [Streptomyces sp. HNM0575]
MTSPQSWGEAHEGKGGPAPGGGPGGPSGPGDPGGPGGPTGPGGPGGPAMWDPALSRPPRNGLGVAALTLGLIGALLFWTVLGGVVLGLLALIFGIVGFRRGRRGEATNGTLAAVGAVIGTLALLGSTVVLVFAVSLLSSGDYDELRSCVEKATTQAEQEQCQKDFVDSVSP